MSSAPVTDHKQIAIPATLRFSESLCSDVPTVQTVPGSVCLQRFRDAGAIVYHGTVPTPIYHFFLEAARFTFLQHAPGQSLHEQRVPTGLPVGPYVRQEPQYRSCARRTRRYILKLCRFFQALERISRLALNKQSLLEGAHWALRDNDVRCPMVPGRISLAVPDVPLPAETRSRVDGSTHWRSSKIRIAGFLP